MDNFYLVLKSKDAAQQMSEHSPSLRKCHNCGLIAVLIAGDGEVYYNDVVTLVALAAGRSLPLIITTSNRCGREPSEKDVVVSSEQVRLLYYQHNPILGQEGRVLQMMMESVKRVDQTRGWLRLANDDKELLKNRLTVARQSQDRLAEKVSFLEEQVAKAERDLLLMCRQHERLVLHVEGLIDRGRILAELLGEAQEVLEGYAKNRTELYGLIGKIVVHVKDWAGFRRNS